MSAVARWDAFLAQIRARHDEVRAEAEASARQFIATVAPGGDYGPLSHHMSAVRARLRELESKIIDTWHAVVEDALFAEGGSDADRDREYARGNAVKRGLDNAREELEPRLFAELARQRYAHAISAVRVVTCGACGLQHAAPIAYRAIQLPCESCRAWIPFEPDALMRSVAAIGAHALAQEAAVHEWRAMRAAEARVHDTRPPRPLALIGEWERSQIAYWRAYLGVRAQFEPELGRDLGMEVRSRMEDFYRAIAAYETAWVEAGGPRTPIA